MSPFIIKNKIILFTAILFSIFSLSCIHLTRHYHYPAEGNHISAWEQLTPEELELNPRVIDEIGDFIKQNPYVRNNKVVPSRWALWRNGYLVHVEGDFNRKTDVASLRKTWHAMIVGAAIQQVKIKSVSQNISEFLPELQGNDAKATWENVLTQSAGFDYPYATFPDYKPGEMWTYSDLNLVHLCNAIARVYGKTDYHDSFHEVAGKAYFDQIGMEGWETRIVMDNAFGGYDGVRLILNLEHMGRLGLLALAGGKWKGEQLIPRSFVKALETKQTYGMKVNYNGPNDGKVEYDEENFPECPYGYLTWVNTDGDLFVGADNAWAMGSGGIAGRVLWNKKTGIVFACVGLNPVSENNSIPCIIEKNLTRNKFRFIKNSSE